MSALHLSIFHYPEDDRKISFLPGLSQIRLDRKQELQNRFTGNFVRNTSEMKKNDMKGQDNAQKNPVDNETQKTTRYSDDELKEFKEMITAKLDESKKTYELMKQTLSLKDDHGTDDTSPSFKLIEDAGDQLNKEEISQYAIRQLKYISHLENALIRIENKTYGICRMTGKLISKERLRSVPHSTLSIDAKRGIA